MNYPENIKATDLINKVHAGKLAIEDLKPCTFTHMIPVYIPIGKNPNTKTDELLLLEDFSYMTKDGTIITAKAGFVFDGASIPKWAWSIIGHPFSSGYVRAALIHDILYGTEIFDRKTCDKIFREMLEHESVKKWKIPLMYRAVRIGGGFVWNKHIPSELELNKTYLEIIKKGES